MPRTNREFPKGGVLALGALVVGLGVVVALAMPKDRDLAASDASIVETDGEPAAAVRGLPRLAEATCEIAVLTSRPEAEARALAEPGAVERLLDVRHCGGACDAVKQLMADKDHYEIEVVRSEDYILPAKESWSTLGAGLTASERASIGERAIAFVVRTRGEVDVRQLPARAAFAVTAAAAEALGGIVYDESVRRFETAAQLLEHAATAPLGQNVFSPRQIAVQIYREEDGTARLLTLGLVRFGSPDLSIRRAPPELATSLASVLDALARRAAGVRTDVGPVTVEEIAMSTGQAAPARDAGAGVPLEVARTEHTEGDPDNELFEVVPRGGSSPDAWRTVAAELFGEAPALVLTANDPELQAIASKARRELPAAIKRMEKGDGSLFVKGPFPIPEESRLDGGAREEWLWAQVTSCDGKACTGPLTNAPGYATNLAAGKEVSVARAEAADWLLRLPDGGTAGGASVTVLEKRAAGTRRAQ
ncbi:MAG: hypothetical protein JWP97_2560 [Labilithrix sp.]|nr:hypothetical protein [Labilithrix sp.]